jgi:phospholipid-translocating ATPase
MALLYTSDSSGTVFVRTDQLDGETDWKVRESIKKTQQDASRNLLELFDESWEIMVEPPCDWIYNFKGLFTSSDHRQALKLSNTLWANMKIASGEAIGVVIYVGKETRIELNNKETKAKFGKTDKDINLMTKYLFAILILLSFILTILSGQIAHKTALIFFTRVFIIMSCIIPISMKVNVDFAKLYYSWGINHDQGIKGAVARNSNIPEELGRVQYLLSDKTGTLTQNSMKFKKFSSLFKKYRESDFTDMKTQIETYW